MSRGLLFQAEYRPLFSGHETFPLRYGWLKKAFDAVKAGTRKKTGFADKSIFLDEGAIARFGVGKNMVASMRHWATCVGIIAEDGKTGSLMPTPFGEFIFGEGGIDPYLEDPSSLWHLHWLLCTGEPERPIKTTWYWAFNHYNASQFRRDDLVEGLLKLSAARGWQRASRTTIQRDVECFVRMYEAHPTGAAGAVEENLESPLAELGLVRGHKGNFNLVRGAKPTLPDGLFAVALDSFWNRQGSTKTLSFEMIAHEPGSPGRVFLLDESELAGRLLALDDVTRGRFRWSETAGLKQVFREQRLRESEKVAFLRRDYREVKIKDAA
jgi:hypothetical protein